jgi:hypothetical protein
MKPVAGDGCLLRRDALDPVGAVVAEQSAAPDLGVNSLTQLRKICQAKSERADRRKVFHISTG